MSSVSPTTKAFVLGAVAGICAWQLAQVASKRVPEILAAREKVVQSVDLAPEPEPQRTDVPDDAPEDCPGVESEQAGKSSSCAGCPNQQICASGEAKVQDPAADMAAKNLRGVKKKVLVLSGKGGVGKSTVSAQLAFSFARKLHVGLLDIDLCGPSVPRMLGLQGQDVHQSRDGWSPVYVDDHLAVMSIGFLLPNQDDAVIFRGPKKNGLIRQFVTDVTWGDLDVLLVDTPPGTSDEHLSIVTYLKDAGVDGAVVVTTPEEVSLQDVRKELNFCKKVGVPIIGVIENMKGFTDATGVVHDIFPSPDKGGCKEMCEKMGVPYLGSLPLQPKLGKACEAGLPYADTNPDTPGAKAFDDVAKKILTTLKM
mmetsp:Transcript_48003/g.104369  ORF Transcript_48003/g.104369 Transcript_48003/m.104369 type:complete len:367 (-) Transcript_48003:224-1324(-)